MQSRELELKNKITQLESSLKAEKKENERLSNENELLKQKISQLQNNSQSNNGSNLSNNLLESALQLIREKEDIIKDLNEKIKRFPFILEKDEKIISIIFKSVEHKINYSLICKNTDNIHKLEEELYKQYPNLTEKDNYFFYKDQQINKFKNFESINLKNGDILIINSKDNSGLFNIINK